MLRVLGVQFSCFALSMLFSVVHAAGQMDFERQVKGSRLFLTYQFQDNNQVAYSVSLTLDRKAVEQSAEQFKPINPRLLRKQAKQERTLQTRIAVNELQNDYPQVIFDLSNDNTVHWRIGIDESYKLQRQSSFELLMQAEVDEISRRYPQASIRTTEDSGYEISAPSQATLNSIHAALESAMQRSQETIRQQDQAQESFVKDQSDEIRQRLIYETDLIADRMQGFELDYYQARWYQEYQDNGLLPDYARIANASLTDLQPVVLRLRPWLAGLSKREAINRLLLLIQSIPYDQLDNRATDAGFLMPLSVLAQNRGDCDSKSVLFAALLRKLFPGTPVAMVLLKQHALLAVGLPVEQGDASIRFEHRNWVLAEPVGPAIIPLGEAGHEYQKNSQQIEAVMRIF